jgi:hypothetical protein
MTTSATRTVALIVLLPDADEERAGRRGRQRGPRPDHGASGMALLNSGRSGDVEPRVLTSMMALALIRIAAANLARCPWCCDQVVVEAKVHPAGNADHETLCRRCAPWPVVRSSMSGSFAAHRAG